MNSENSRKRKGEDLDSSFDSVGSSPLLLKKKPKMNLSEECRKDIVKQLLSGLGEQVTSAVNEKLDSLDQKQTERLDKLEREQGERMLAIKAELREELSKEIKDRGEAGFRLGLAQQVKITSKNLLVFGIATDNPSAKLLELGSKIGIEKSTLDTVTILKWHGLGKKGYCFELGSEYHRNCFLEKAKHLDLGISFDKDVPPPYRAKYKEFKLRARKDRHFMGLQTRIGIVECVLTLKVRKERTEGWRITDEFIPTPNAVVNTMLASGNKAEGGVVPFVPNQEAIDIARRTIRIAGYPESKIDGLTAEISRHVTSPLKKAIRTVSFKHGAANVICNDIESAKQISKICNGKKIEISNRTLYFENY